MSKKFIQAIPTNLMSCFQVENEKKKLHYRSCEWLSTPEALGGFGFLDVALFNQVMLGHRGFRLLTNPSSPCARVLNACYYPNRDVLDAPQPYLSLYTYMAGHLAWYAIVEEESLVGAQKGKLLPSTGW